MWTPPGYPVDASIALPSHSGCQSEPCNGLVALRVHRQPGYRLIDGVSGTAPYIQLANDPKGTSYGANALLSEGGKFKARARFIPAFDVDKDIDKNIRAELRWEYGDDWWDAYRLLGTSSAEAIILD